MLVTWIKNYFTQQLPPYPMYKYVEREHWLQLQENAFQLKKGNRRAIILNSLQYEGNITHTGEALLLLEGFFLAVDSEYITLKARLYNQIECGKILNGFDVKDKQYILNLASASMYRKTRSDINRIQGKKNDHERLDAEGVNTLLTALFEPNCTVANEVPTLQHAQHSVPASIHGSVFYKYVERIHWVEIKKHNEYFKANDLAALIQSGLQYSDDTQHTGEAILLLDSFLAATTPQYCELRRQLSYKFVANNTFSGFTPIDRQYLIDVAARSMKTHCWAASKHDLIHKRAHAQVDSEGVNPLLTNMFNVDVRKKSGK